MKLCSKHSSKLSSMLACSTAALAFAGAAVFAAGLPPERQVGSASYVTGGVSDEEAQTFKAARAEYPLVIELAQRTGGKNEFTADAQVQVMNASGAVVLNAKAEGPFMLVRLPPGNYRVQATLNGKTLEAKPVTVGARGSAEATIVFPPNTD